MALHALVILLTLCALCHRPKADDDNKNPNLADGRHAMVHLFEWRWDDIADECETFLGPYGYGAVQVSPPNENLIVMNPGYNPAVVRPWFERYQPVSYVLGTRSGSRSEFIDMVDRCNKASVRIYVDIVVNHMTGNGAGTGVGTNGSYYDAGSETFTGVPYNSSDFHSCPSCGTASCNIESYQDANQVRNCRLDGLLDLDQSNEDVQNLIVEYMNDLVDIGVAGFRFDAAKHMWPQDIQAIVGKLKTLRDDIFPDGSKPFIYQEVIDMGGEAVKSSDYTGIGRVTEFHNGINLGRSFRGQSSLKYLQNWGADWSMLNDGDALVFVDNHDTQRSVSDTILTFFDSRLYKMAVAFMLSWPYGFPRVMSSYNWPRYIINGQDINYWVGPPHDDQFNILHIQFDDTLACVGDRICEHRWRQIYNMVRFRNTVDGTQVTNWQAFGENQIAFSRGNKGFLVINGETFDLNQTLQTGLSAGIYCDVISGNLKNGTCTGKVVNINNDGTAQFTISNTWEDPMMAIHTNAKIV